MTRNEHGRIRRAVVISSVVLTALALSLIAVLQLMPGDMLHNAQRLSGMFGDSEAGLSEGAPPFEGRTFLLAGPDSAAPVSGAAPQSTSPCGGLIAVVRIAADRRSVAMVSIPRDSWVDIPGHGRDKISTACAYGGPGLLVRTVEKMTGDRITKFAGVDLAGVARMVDALGGVDVGVSQPVRSGPLSFHTGLNHLDGNSAITYILDANGLPGGDLDRVRRQQNLLRVIASKASSIETLSDPDRTRAFLDAAPTAVGASPKSTSNMGELELQVRALRSNWLRFATVPVAATETRGDQKVVHLDARIGTEFWRAFKSDSLDRYLATHPADTLPTIPR